MFDIFFNIVFVICLIIILFLMIWPISLPLLIYYLIKRANNRKQFKSNVIRQNDFTKTNYKDIDPSKIAGFDIEDVSKLKVFLFDIFYKFETAYNSLDYNTMYNLSTPRLYNMYHSSMVVNSKFDEKKIIEAVDLKKMFLYDAYASDYRQVVHTLIEISSISYTQNSKGKIVSGSPNERITEKFQVTFYKQLKGNKNYRCPNCGANVSGTTCEYCKSTINDCEFRIDSIKKVI